MERRSSQVSTWVAIGSLAIALVSAAYGVGGELSSMKAQQAATDQRIARVEGDSKGSADLAREILQRLARIEGKLDQK